MRAFFAAVALLLFVAICAAQVLVWLAALGVFVWSIILSYMAKGLLGAVAMLVFPVLGQGVLAFICWPSDYSTLFVAVVVASFLVAFASALTSTVLQTLMHAIDEDAAAWDLPTDQLQRGTWLVVAAVVVVCGAVWWISQLSGSPTRSGSHDRPPEADSPALHESRININTARRSELEAVPGIGPITATRIMDGRPWRRVEDLQHLRGVKRDKFRAMFPHLTVGIEDVRPWKNVRDELIEADERRRSDVSAAP